MKLNHLVNEQEIMKSVEGAKESKLDFAYIDNVKYSNINKVCQVLADNKYIDIYVEKNQELNTYTVFVYDLY